MIRFRAIFSIFVVSAGVACAQVPAQLSPQAAYDQATRPIEIVHRAVSNWSDVEQQSLAVAIKQAAIACAARRPEEFAGDELLTFAKLCSLGQNWPAMGTAGQQYIDSKDVAKPQLSLAYAYKLEADLHTRDLQLILGTAKAMLAANPYDAIVDGSSSEALEYMQLAYTVNGLQLHELREPILLAQLAAEKPAVPRPTLYADGLAKASLEQYLKQPEKAAETVAALDAALALAKPSSDETLLIADARKRYELLGKPLPPVTIQLSLFDVRETPRMNADFGGATAIFLLPDWCAQCVRMVKDGIYPAMNRVSEDSIRVYALLSQAPANKATLLAEQERLDAAQQRVMLHKPPLPLVAAAEDAAPPAAAMLLLHTPTFVVPQQTPGMFAASDFPMLIVVDHAGIVRFAQTAPENAMEKGGFLDRVATHVATAWPGPDAAPSDKR